jgi:gentisate 1,2-dioxygenase
VRIPAGKFNEKHKHARETLIHILEGTGQVLLDDRVIAVRPGDTILVPRWALHQTQNLGVSEMRFPAVTDFNLTRVGSQLLWTLPSQNHSPPGSCCRMTLDSCRSPAPLSSR